MTICALFRLILPVVPVLISYGEFLAAQSVPAPSSSNDADLRFVVILSRHGVRSPTGKPEQYAPYSNSPWPEWSVQPGYLTAHGFELMKLFGAYDRAWLAGEGLLAPSGCADTEHVTILADSDQRTRETGKALAEGMFPGCTIDVHARPEGAHDPLFHTLSAGVAQVDSALAAAAIAGRIGGDANNLTGAYRPQLAALDRLLAGCGHAPADAKRTSLFDMPAHLAPGRGGHPAELRGPLATASSLAENLLLEYSQGMTGSNLGWGCLDEPTLREVMQLHAAEADFSERTPVIARMYASNLLDHILKTMQQQATGKPVAGALGSPGDRLLIISGHDTNITTVAGALGLNWIIDGRLNDTPPGGALVLELWRSHAGGQFFVRLHYTAQTLAQMRTAEPLTSTDRPAIAPLFLPGCSRQDLTCAWESFATTVWNDLDPAYVSAQP